jgi:aspartate/methionine/tyrosine aminotransferase
MEKNLPPDPKDISAYTDHYRKEYWNVSGREKDYAGLGTGSPNWQPYPPAVELAKTNLGRAHILNSYGSTAGTYHAHYYLPQLERMGIKLPDNDDAKKYMTPGNGVTQLYTAAVNSLLNENDVLLMPVPTYGYFLKKEHLSHTNVRPLALSPDNGFKLTPEMLDECIERTNKEMYPKRVTAFLNLNPHNPTGVVYYEEDIKALAEVLKKHKIRLVIDDMVYAGLELDRAFYDPEKCDEKKMSQLKKALPFPFASVEGMFDKTITLFGLSKAYSLPGLRAGLAVGPKEFIHPVRQYIGDSVEFATPIAQAAMTNVFGKDKDNTRNTYLYDQASHFLFRYLGLRAMINGMDDELVKRFLPKIDADNLSHVLCMDQITVNTKLKENDQDDGFDYTLIHKMMKDQMEEGGVKGLSIYTVFSGFFAILDLTSLKGKYYGNQQINNGLDLVQALVNCSNLDGIPGEAMGYHGDRLLMRISISADTDRIVRGIVGIKNLMEKAQDHPFDLPKSRSQMSR